MLTKGYKKLRIEKACNAAHKKGGKCLSQEYKNTHANLLWECAEGHQWNASFKTVVVSECWCRKCSYPKTTKYNLKYCQSIANNYGGKCLSAKYNRVGDIMSWECSKGHTWDIAFARILYEKIWCYVCCKSKTQKKTIEDCRELAKSKDGKCLALKYTNCRIKMPWECSKGHRWNATYTSITLYWCPECSITKKKTIEDCRRLAKNKGGKCLSNKYGNNKTKLIWECSKLHTWNTSRMTVFNGHWCPRCSRGSSKPQEFLLEILQRLYPRCTILYNFTGFNWLSTSVGGKQEIDIFIKDIKLAVEYDGRHHFMPIDFSGSDKTKAIKAYNTTKRLDNLKDNKIANNPVDVAYFIRFNYLEKITKDYVKNKLMLHNIPVNNIFNAIKVNDSNSLEVNI